MTETTKPVSFAAEREALILQEIEFMLLAQRTLENLRSLNKKICANQKSELQNVISNGRSPTQE